jgi:SWI/SNF-related matrix-associated actin-dependent regulator 1 of chromatin subfamily A
MGLGKTVIAAKTILKGERVLVICPATLKINWETELKLWSNTPKITIIKKKSETLPKGPGTAIVNYDILGQKASKKKGARAVANFDFSGFDRVIVDEFHFTKNPKSIRSKITGKIIKNTPKVLLLSGTIMERPVDLYVPYFSIGATTDSYHTFGVKYCDAKKVYLGQREVWQYRGSTDPEGLRELIAPYTLHMKKEDVIDLPDRTISVVALDLPVGRQEKNYDFSDIVKDPRPIGFEGLAELLHEQGLKKVPLALKHIKMRLETEKKIFVTARHSDVIDALYEGLKDFNPVIIDGRMNANGKENSKELFQENENVRVLIGQTKAAGVGLTLTAASHVVMVEPDWSYSAIMQLIDRCHRIGQTNNVTAELLTIHKSIDERVLWTTLEKKGFIQGVIK